jgi:hypothetical protein
MLIALVVLAVQAVAVALLAVDLMAEDLELLVRVMLVEVAHHLLAVAVAVRVLLVLMETQAVQLVVLVE